MKRANLAAALATAMVFAASWTGCRAFAKEARMDEAVFGKVERVYAGRFSLEVPAGARRYGEEYQIRDFTVREHAFEEPLDKAFQAAWGAKLAEIAERKAKRLRPNWIDGEVYSQHELEPGRFAAVLFHPNNAKTSVNYAALRQAGVTGIWITRPGEVQDRDDFLRAITLIGKAYQPVSSEAPHPKGDVFHLPHGVVALPYQDQESAKAVFQGGPLDVEIKLSTESTPEPEGGGLMARFGESVMKAGAAFAAGASPVRNRGRKVAGMKGEEFVMRDSEGGTLYFLWEFKGEADSGARPEIQLQMITSDERQKEKMAYWDAVVDSLRPAAAP